MKKEHTNFITGLLTNSKLTTHQRDRVVELALRDLSKNGSEERILHDLELIKDNLGIKVELPKKENIGGNKSKNGPWIDLISEYEKNEKPEVQYTKNGNNKTSPVTDEIIEKYSTDNNHEKKEVKANKQNTDNALTKEDPKRDLNEVNENSKKSNEESDVVQEGEQNSTVIKKINDHQVKKEINSKLSELPIYLNPSNLFKFLSAYNQDPVLKYTCHEIDDQEIIEGIKEKCETQDYDLVKHQELICRGYDELAKKHFVNPNIKNLILVYLTGTSFTGKNRTWSSEKININWNSPELTEWGKKNPGIVPNPGQNLINKTKNRGFKFKKALPSELRDKKITSFSGLVIHFKDLFHIRGDNPLKTLINRINELEQWNETIHFDIREEDFWGNLEFFTDVDKLLQAFKAIVRIILDAVKKGNMEKPQINLAFKEEDFDVVFSIHHINSIYGKTITNTTERIGTSQTLLIKNQINGLCDLYLQANFDHNHFAEVNLWNGHPRKAIKLEKFQGVKYILKFKK